MSNNFRQFAGAIQGSTDKTSKFPTFEKFEKDYIGVSLKLKMYIERFFVD